MSGLFLFPLCPAWWLNMKLAFTNYLQSTNIPSHPPSSSTPPQNLCQIHGRGEKCFTQFKVRSLRLPPARSCVSSSLLLPATPSSSFLCPLTPSCSLLLHPAPFCLLLLFPGPISTNCYPCYPILTHFDQSYSFYP